MLAVDKYCDRRRQMGSLVERDRWVLLLLKERAGDFIKKQQT